MAKFKRELLISESALHGRLLSLIVTYELGNTCEMKIMMDKVLVRRIWQLRMSVHWRPTFLLIWWMPWYLLAHRCHMPEVARDGNGENLCGRLCLAQQTMNVLEAAR
jgi:hypothetical protein